MSSRNEFARARAPLQLEMPISDDVNLVPPQADVEGEIEHSLAPDGIVSSALQELASDLLRHVARKQSRSRAAGLSKPSDH
jgi:hypothetical protein